MSGRAVLVVMRLVYLPVGAYQMFADEKGWKIEACRVAAELVA